jgi:hypothetical protein
MLVQVRNTLYVLHPLPMLLRSLQSIWQKLGTAAPQPRRKQLFHMLTSLLLLPLFGVLLLCTMADTTAADLSRVKKVTLTTSLATFILSIVM